MKLIFTLIASIAIMSNVFAGETSPHPKSFRKIAQEEIKCGANVDEIVAQIKVAPGCYEAMNIAKTCAWGASGDVQQVVAAQAICEKDFKKITKDDALLKAKMARRCEKLCNPKTDGTMCLAQISFCSLSVTEFWSQFYSSSSL